MNTIVVAIVTMSASAIGAFLTALTEWFRRSATQHRLYRTQHRLYRMSPPLGMSPPHIVSLKITSSDGQAVELVVDRDASDAEVGEMIARALRRADEKDSDVSKDDNRASGAGGTVSD